MLKKILFPNRTRSKEYEEILEHKLIEPRLVHQLEQIDTLNKIWQRKENENFEFDKLISGTVAAYSYENYDPIVQFYDINQISQYCIKEEFNIDKISSSKPYLMEMQDIQDDSLRINLSNSNLQKLLSQPFHKEMVYLWPRLGFLIDAAVEGKTSFEEKYGSEPTKLFTAIYGEGAYRAKGAEARFGRTKGYTLIYYPNKNQLNNILFEHNNTNTKYLLGISIGERLDIGGGLISGKFSGIRTVLKEK